MNSPLACSDSYEASTPHWLLRISDAVKATDYGSVTIKIHDGRVVEIESARKWRLHSPGPTKHIHPLPTTRVEASDKNRQPIPAVHLQIGIKK